MPLNNFDCKDERLIIRLLMLRDTQNEGFKRIIACFGRIIRRPPRNWGADSEAIRDHFQEVLETFLLKYVRQPGKLRAGSLKGLLRGLSNNMWLNEMRKKRSQGKAEEEAVERLKEREKEARKAMADSEKFEEMLKGLSEKCKQIVRLRLLWDLTFQEIAELLGESVSEKIRKKYYRCIDNLKPDIDNP